MSSCLTAAHFRHIKTLKHGDPVWHWTALQYGHAQPRGFRTYWRSRYFFSFHVTPIHLSRDGSKWSYGVCLGKRTLIVFRHR